MASFWDKPDLSTCVFVSEWKAILILSASLKAVPLNRIEWITTETILAKRKLSLERLLNLEQRFQQSIPITSQEDAQEGQARILILHVSYSQGNLIIFLCPLLPESESCLIEKLLVILFGDNIITILLDANDAITAESTHISRMMGLSIPTLWSKALLANSNRMGKFVEGKSNGINQTEIVASTDLKVIELGGQR